MTGSDDRDDGGVTRTLAEEITTAATGAHPENVEAIVRRAVVDAIGNALLARETPLGAGYLSAADMIDSDDGYGVIGGGSATAVDAAFTNAGLINALDWDDTADGGGHPGASLIPAALVAGGRTGATVDEMIDALVAGYETSCRVVRALTPTWERYAVVHGSGTRHAIGAGATAAALTTSDIASVQEMLGYAAQLAPVAHAANFGWEENRLTWLKDNNARAASAGIRAQSLDGAFTSPRRILDGDGGFWRMAGSDQCDWEVLARPFDDPYLLETLEFKPFPCCRWLHSVVEATRRATDDVGSVERVQVETAELVAEKFLIDPTNQVNAEFSLPYTVSQAASGRDRFEWYDEDGPRPAPSVDVVTRIDDTHTHRFEESYTVGATVTVTDGSGSTATITVDQPLGTPERPIPDGLSERKLEEGCRRCFGSPERAERIQTLLQSDEPVTELVEALGPAAEH